MNENKWQKKPQKFLQKFNGYLVSDKKTVESMK